MSRADKGETRTTRKERKGSREGEGWKGGMKKSYM